jgi:PIN domain nuclease of toxin-antitoxin system
VKKILLDTHTFIWWVDNSPKLSKKAGKIIADLDNACYFSLVSSWEIAIKCSIGKLELTIPLREYIPQHMAVNAFKQLPISFQHVSRVETLPLHHRDPFDRLLAAQAMTEKLVIVSADESFDLYGVQRVW